METPVQPKRNPATPSKVEKTKDFVHPSDWPKAGAIDLAVHDLPHQSSTIEWWYMNCHVTTKEGRQLSVFASFFRRLLEYDEKKKRFNYGHSITWAIFDDKGNERKEKYFPVSLVDKVAPKIGLDKIKKGEIVNDHRLRKAVIEMLEKGNVPYPDRLIQEDVEVDENKLNLYIDGNTYTKRADGTYDLHLYDDEQQVGCTLNFAPQKPPVRHGDNGVVLGVSSENMFYYFIPRCEVKGTITLKKENLEVSGSGWYDHEFGKPPEKKKDKNGKEKEEPRKDVGWNWLSTQLDNGYEISAYDLFDLSGKTPKGVGKWAIVIDPKGNRKAYTKFNLQPLDKWTSMRTFNDYPIKWKLEIPEAKIALDVTTPFEQQEFMTVISKPAFWEGRINTEGTFNGKTVKGPGFVERHGFFKLESMDDFFKVVSRETLKSIEKILPHNPTPEKLIELVSHKKNKHHIDGIDTKQYSDALIKPIRTIIDRRGKSWRSYAALACCDIVGGNSQHVSDWLAMPELMHVGSLIVDDVEDKSPIRRGGPSCHVLFGEPIAINAGTAAYFIGQIIVYHADFIKPKQKVEIYNLYFESLRAAHSGQALDISGLDYMMPEVVKTGNGKLLEKRVFATHRLKSAVPASTLAMTGALMGGGSKKQVDAIGRFYENLGVAFQIVDDALNLSGFKNNLKTKAEDLSEGKITFPVAKAMSRLDYKQRKELWDIIRSKPKNLKKLGRAVQLIEDCGAIQACQDHARELIDTEWKKLDPLIRDSFSKLMLRAFSWYVLDRQY
ncbi:MAG: polyprenyl synthetase family protein [Chitinophagales bacterium]|nr:polyprenyl synthetase family protein [Chitinophagales bacterium]